MKKLTCQISILTLCGMLALTGCDQNQSAGPAAAGALPDESISENVVYLMSGKVEADEKVDITAKITARVAEVYVDMGSAVEKGDVVMTLDAKDIQAQIAQAQAVKAQAQSALNGANISYKSAKDDYEKSKMLFDAGAISQSQLNQYQDKFSAAETSQRVSESQVNETQAALELAQNQLNNSTITAPISGIVSEKGISAGELAMAGTLLTTIVNSDAVGVKAYLPAALISKIKIGQQVVIKVSEIPDQVFAGTISAIDPAIDPENKSILVKVHFDRQDPQLKDGMFAEVGFENWE